MSKVFYFIIIAAGRREAPCGNFFVTYTPQNVMRLC